MKKTISKKTIIIAIAFAAYAVMLPLVLYFSGAFKPKAIDPPDLNIGGVHYSPQYIEKTAEEKAELLKSIGFDLEAFETAGFSFSDYGLRFYVHEDQPNILHSIRIDATDGETYWIRLTIYMPGADRSFSFGRPYKRHEINGKPVGFYEPSDQMNDGEIRYHDTQTECVYIFDLFFDFDEATEAFLKILVS